MIKTKRWLALTLAIILLFSLSSIVVLAASGDTIVYRTKTGDCYHTKSCSYLKKSSIQITLQQAVNSGLRPCSRCHPPTLDSSSRSNTGSSSVGLTPINHDLLSQKQGIYGSGTQFLIDIEATCTKNDHVGKEWTQEYSVAGFVINSGDIVAFNKGNELEIKTTITQKDSNGDDIGKKITIYEVSSGEFEEGFIVKQTITVKENGGKYKGNTAKWKVVYTFTRV